MAKKIIKNCIDSYICEKCGNEMFKFSVKDKNLFTADGPFIYRKYLNTVDPNRPYYVCQFCGTIHKGYYINGGLNIDFRSLNGLQIKEVAKDNWEKSLISLLSAVSCRCGHFF